MENIEILQNIEIDIIVKLNQKISVVFYHLKKYDSHLIIQELGNFTLKINVISNGVEKYMSFSVNNKLSFIDGFLLPSFSIDSLVKNLN